MARTLPLHIKDLSPVATDMASLGRIIRNRRAESAMRIDDAASMLGVSKDVLSRLENGRSVGLDKLFAVLIGMGLTLVFLDRTNADTVPNRIATGTEEPGVVSCSRDR